MATTASVAASEPASSGWDPSATGWSAPDHPAVRLPLEVPLAVATPRAMLAAGDEVFVSGDGVLLIYGLDGTLRATVEGLPGAGPLAIAPDGETVYVGLASTPAAVVAVDRASHQHLERWDLPAWPQAVVATEDHVVVSSGRRSGDLRHVHRLDLATGEVTDRLSPWVPAMTVDDRGMVAVLSSHPARLERWSSTGEPLPQPVTATIGGRVVDLATDAVTGTLWVAGSQIAGPTEYQVHTYDAATLAPLGVHELGAYPNAVAPLGDGVHVALARARLHGGEEVFIDRAGSATPIAAFDLAGVVLDRGLAVTGDGSLAVVTVASGVQAGGWLTIIPDPDLAAPRITVRPPAPTVADEPLVLAGEFEPGADVVGGPAGVELDVVDPLGRHVRVTTGAAGEWEAELPGAPGAGLWSLTVLHRGRDGERTAVATATVDISRRTTSLTLEAIADARAGDPLLVRGQVIDPAPVRGHPVTVEVARPGVSSVHATGETDGEGGFAIELPTHAAGTWQVVVRASLTDRNTAAAAPAREVTLRSRQSSIDGLTSTLVAGHPESLAGRLVDEDGGPRSQATVEVRLDGALVGTAVTAVDGTFSTPFTATSPGSASLEVDVPADARHAAAHVAQAVTIRRDRITQALAVPSGTAGQSLALTGTLTDSLDRPVPGVAVEVVVTDADGREVVRRPVTDATGRWATSFTPRRGGSHTVAVSVAEGGAFEASRRTRTFTVARAATAVSLAALPSTVDHGDTLALTGRLTTPAGARLDLVAIDLATGTTTRLARSTVDGDGRLSRTVTARAGTRYEARFLGDATYAPSTASRTVRVRSRVSATISGHDRTVDGQPSFARSSRPTISTRVRAVQPQTRVTVRLQRWNGSAWVTREEWRVSTGTDGRATTRAPQALGAGSYRVRVIAPATPANLEGRSPLLRFRVR